MLYQDAAHHQSSYTLLEAYNMLNKLLPTLNEEEKQMGAKILFRKKENLISLESPATQSFIHLNLSRSIRNAMEESKENLAFDSSGASLKFSSNIPAISGEKSVSTVLFGYDKKRESQNLATFESLATISKKKSKKAPSRLNQFVITLGLPDLPRRHPGVDDTYHPGKDIDPEWLDLLERGHTTLAYLNRQKKKSCDNLIFMRAPVQNNEDRLTKRIHTAHTLDYYKGAIAAEKQLSIEFHFAGHSNSQTVGSQSSDKRMPPEQLAVNFDHMLELCDLKEILQSKEQPLIFHLHVCNGAYVEVDDNMSLQDIKQKIYDESVIGKFYQEMIEKGYSNIKVIGYRGFYQGMTTGGGIRIVDTVKEDNVKIHLSAEHTLHSIESNGSGHEVTLPKNKKGATFPVVLLPMTTALDKRSN